MSLETTIESYYHSPEGLRLTEYVGVNSDGRRGLITNETAPLRHQDLVDAQAVDLALDEVGASLRVIQAGDNTFEIATVNGANTSGDVMLHISTYSSAISTNAGNAYEFAAQSVRYPNAKHLYVASFGNGGSAPLLAEDAAYARKTGRFVRDEDGVETPLPSIRNLHAALEHEGLAVTRVMGTDSAGGHYARALAVAMEPGQLSHAFFSETSGFADLSFAQIAFGMLVREGVQNAKQNRALSPDTEMMDTEKQARAKTALATYEATPQRQQLRAASVGTKGALKSMWNSAQALRRGPNGANDPLVLDTNVLLARHPDAHITYGVAEEDPLYRSKELSHAAAQRLLNALDIQHTPVRTIMIPGMTHAYNTYFPSLYHAVKRRAVEFGLAETS